MFASFYLIEIHYIFAQFVIIELEAGINILLSLIFWHGLTAIFRNLCVKILLYCLSIKFDVI